MEAVPVSKVCPDCGSEKFRKVRARRWVAFTDDRICESCGTRYAPPTPRWAGVVFVLIGVILWLTGMATVLVCLSSLLRGGTPGVIDMVLGAGLVVLGVAVAIHGCRALFAAGSV